MTQGRPTEYNDEIPSAVEKYLTEAAELGRLPTVEGLAVFLDVARSTLYKWAGEKPDFSDILERLLAKQADKLIQGGLAGNFNSTITKLMLTKHDYREGFDHTSGGQKITSINVSVVHGTQSTNDDGLGEELPKPKKNNG